MTKGLIIGGIVGAAAVSLLAGASLSWLFILACPLMMVFMHGGHGHGHGNRHEHQDVTAQRTSDSLEQLASKR